MPHDSSEDRLTAQEEKLIGAYLDGECSFLGGLRVRRLLHSREAARRCLSSMQNASRSVVEALRGANELPKAGAPDLWDRVSVRLMQEERAEVFLGRRKAALPERYSWRKAFAPLGWTATGAAVSALIALLILSPQRPGPVGGYAAEQQVDAPAAFRPVSVDQVGDNGSFMADPLRQQLASAQITKKALQVDWMKSRGSVQVIHDPQRSAIFWVSRNRPSYGNRLERAEPILDITPLARNGEPIRMLEDDFPTAFSAYNGR